MLHVLTCFILQKRLGVFLLQCFGNLIFYFLAELGVVLDDFLHGITSLAEAAVAITEP